MALVSGWAQDVGGGGFVSEEKNTPSLLPGLRGSMMVRETWAGVVESPAPPQTDRPSLSATCPQLGFSVPSEQ